MPKARWIAAASGAAVAVALAVSAAQAQRPRVSPHETHTFTVEGATITITYGRPSTRGRKIFGALVPYNVVWMPGADEATIFQTTAPLQLGDFKLQAGSYSLYTMPSEKQWLLIINKRTGQFHTVYPSRDDLVRLPMTAETLPTTVEQLTIAAVSRPQGGGAIQLEWDTARFSVPFTVSR
jgi:hypothetical protein